MTPIVFPGLGLEFQIDRVAFSVFGKNIYWYGIIIAIGFLLAVGYCCRQARHFGITQDAIMDLLIFAVPLSIIGARIYYVIFYLELFVRKDGHLDWGKVIAIWDGGIAIYGAVITAALTLAIFCRVRKISFGAFADLGVYGFLIGQTIGRWGNFINQEAYGSLTDLPWRMGLTVEGGYIEVHPTFLYESLWNLAGFLILALVFQKRRKFDGQIFLSYIIWYGFGRGIIEGLRTDSLYFFGLSIFGYPIRTSQMLAWVSCAAALVILVILLVRKKHVWMDLYVNRVTVQRAEQAGKNYHGASLIDSDSTEINEEEHHGGDSN